jgi:hypothetical protein
MLEPLHSNNNEKGHLQQQDRVTDSLPAVFIKIPAQLQNEGAFPTGQRTTACVASSKRLVSLPLQLYASPLTPRATGPEPLSSEKTASIPVLQPLQVPCGPSSVAVTDCVCPLTELCADSKGLRRTCSPAGHLSTHRPPDGTHASLHMALHVTPSPCVDCVDKRGPVI